MKIKEQPLLTSETTYLSAERAVRVKTETPTDVSWMKGMTLQPTLPNNHSSDRYRLASTGAQVTSSITSPSARLDMKTFGTFRTVLAEQKVFMSVMLPTSPNTLITP